jgi:hypothetical protein
MLIRAICRAMAKLEDSEWLMTATTKVVPRILMLYRLVRRPRGR